jgi:trk system potassium uptake protein TrkA
VTVLQSDPTDPSVFAEEQLEECDAFVAVSSDDEHNILAALQAKAMGAQFTAVVVQQSTFLSLLSNLGIDRPYSPRILAAKEVLQLIDDSPVRRLATLAAGVAEVYELDPASRGPALGKPLRQVKLPPGAFVAAVQRRGTVHVPGAEDVTQSGDVLIVIGPTGIEKRLRDLFIGK